MNHQQSSPPLILASVSPRRQELITQLGRPFSVFAADIDENLAIDDPAALTMELSFRKADAVAKHHPGCIVIGADTVVSIDGEILGKPRSETEALAMLERLSGRTHQVYTGVTLLSAGSKAPRRNTFFVCTDVTMYHNSTAFLQAYIASGEPMDKAGAYGIQGRGALLVEKIHGDYFNVVGLPIARLYRELEDFDRAEN